MKEQHPLVWVTGGQQEIEEEVKSSHFLFIWTHEMEEKVVEIWQEHLCLFDVSAKQYHNRFKKQNTSPDSQCVQCENIFDFFENHAIRTQHYR